MQAPAVRQAIIDAIVGTLTASRARSGDVLAIHRHRTEPESVTSRTWMVTMTNPPLKSELDSCDLFSVSYQLSGFYPSGQDTDDRAASDVERLYTPLWRLHESIADMQSSEVGEATVEDGINMLVVRLPITVLYRLDSTLI